MNFFRLMDQLKKIPTVWSLFEIRVNLKKSTFGENRSQLVNCRENQLHAVVVLYRSIVNKWLKPLNRQTVKRTRVN